MARQVIRLLLVFLAPVMSSNVFDVTNFGAKGDGITNNTASFRAAAAAVSAANGGMLFVPLGVYLTGSFNLSSNCVFRIHGIVRGIRPKNLSTALYDYPLLPWYVIGCG